MPLLRVCVRVCGTAFATPFFSLLCPFNRCKWSFQGRRADGTKKEGAPTDTGAEGFVEMPSGAGGTTKWRALVITTVPR